MPWNAKIYTIHARWLGALTALGLAAAPATAQCAAPVPRHLAVRDSLLVTPAWLAAHLKDPDLVVLHVGMGMNAAAYGKAHVPGARWVTTDAFIDDRPPGTELPSADSIAAVLGALGVTNRSRVVLYGDPWMLGRVFLALDYVGHGNRTAVLDGGLPAWRAAGLPVSTVPERATRAVYTPRPQPDLVVDAAWVNAHRNDPAVVLLDGRTGPEYAGTTRREGLPRAGHIPGARPLDWATTFTDSGRAVQDQSVPLQSPARLHAMLDGAGVRPNQTLVTYCTVGLRASHLYFVLRYLGFAPRIYDGSMNDWSARFELPISTGNARGSR
jgi:thiosulfate/3-mercaptopyruvate sulfurtransferase